MKPTNEELQGAVLRQQLSHRGGGIEIDLSRFGYPNGSKMSAYQNYLGGGMLGRINNDCNISNWMNDNKLLQIARALAEYMHSLTNHDDDEWESASFEENQRRPSSAY